MEGRCYQGIQQKNPICFYHTALHGILLSEEMYRYVIYRLYLYVTDTESWGLMYLDQQQPILNKIKDIFKSKSNLLTLFTNSDLICKKNVSSIVGESEFSYNVNRFIFMKMLYNHLFLSTHLTQHNPNKQLDIALHLLSETTLALKSEKEKGSNPYKYFNNILMFMYPSLSIFKERVYTHQYDINKPLITSDFIKIIESNENDIIIIRFTNNILPLLLKENVTNPDGKVREQIDDSLLRVKIYQIMKTLNNDINLNLNYTLSFAALSYTDRLYKSPLDMMIDPTLIEKKVGHSIIGTFCGDIPSIVDANNVSEPILNVPWNKGLILPIKTDKRRSNRISKTNEIVKEYSEMVESYLKKQTHRTAALHTAMNQFDKKYYNTNIDTLVHSYEKLTDDKKIIKAMDYIVYVKKNFSRINLEIAKHMLENLK